MNGPKRIRLLLVEDDPDLVALLRLHVLNDERFELVGVARDGREAILQLDSRRPDVMLLDLGLPALAGDRLVGMAAALHPDVRVVVYSARQDDEVARSVRRAGGDYLTKGSHQPREVFDRVFSLVTPS